MCNAGCTSCQWKEPLERPVISTPVFEMGVTLAQPPSGGANAYNNRIRAIPLHLQLQEPSLEKI